MRFALIFVILNIASFIIIPPACALTEDISAPNRIPRFYGFRTPEIEPGGMGKYNFTVKNRYNKSMYNVSIVIEIYMFATLEYAKKIEEISSPPVIREGNKQTYRTNPFTLDANETKVITVTILTDKDTPQGTYFIRHSIDFEMNNTKYTMKSRGFFSSNQWEAATNPAGNGSVGGINLTLLGVDGIVPDSSFSVREPPSPWPMMILIGMTIFFAVAAFVLYAVEEKEGYLKIKKSFYYWSGKFKKSWRPKKKKFRK